MISSLKNHMVTCRSIFRQSGKANPQENPPRNQKVIPKWIYHPFKLLTIRMRFWWNLKPFQWLMQMGSQTDANRKPWKPFTFGVRQTPSANSEGVENLGFYSTTPKSWCLTNAQVLADEWLLLPYTGELQLFGAVSIWNSFSRSVGWSGIKMSRTTALRCNLPWRKLNCSEWYLYTLAKSFCSILPTWYKP